MCGSGKRLGTEGSKDRNFLSKVIAYDEMWVHYFNLKRKRESEVWRTFASPKTKKVHQQKSAGKVMLCVFFDARGVIYQCLVPPKTKINAVYYVQALKSLQKHINKKRLEIARLWILHQDNATPHITSIIRDFLEKHEIPTFAHPSDSPDLASCDIWLFPSPKKALRTGQFSSHQEVVTASQTFFKSLLQADFEKPS